MSTAPPRPPAGWHPDPHQRHELRWWDGARWAASVADGDVVAADPAGVPAPRGTRWLAAAAAATAAGALVAGLAFVAATGPAPHDCTTADRSIEGDVAAGVLDRHCVRLAPGQALRVRVEPTDFQDVTVAVAVDEGEAASSQRLVDRSEDLYAGDLRAPGAGREAVVVVADARAAAEPDAGAFGPLVAGVEVAVLVGGFEGAPGGYRLVIELLDPPVWFDPDDYPDQQTFDEEVVGTPAFDAHYGPFFEGDFYP